MTPFLAGEHQATIRDLAALGLPGSRIALSDEARQRIARSREIVAEHLKGDQAIYGLNTGLGGNLGFRLDAEGIDAFQVQLLRGRAIGAGQDLPREVCRAALAARILTASRGTAGLSQAVIDGLVALYNAGVTPAAPRHGSIGATDIGLNAHIGIVLIGRGRAWVDDRLLPGAEALAAAGLKPVALEPKDGLGLCNNASTSAGLGAVTLAGLADTLLTAAGVAALAYEGYAANPTIFDPRLQAAHPNAGQVEAAALFRALLAGSSIHERQRKIQDAISFRTLAPGFGMALVAFGRARAEAETSINGVQDTPLVLLEDAEMLSSPNFYTSGLAHAYDALAIAVAQLATASVHRMIKLMTPTLSELPKYLSPVGGPSNGYVTTQKLASSLQAEIKLYATPVSTDAIPVSDAVEDVAPQTFLAIRKLDEQMKVYRLLVALEAVVAAQAADLREGLRFGPAGAALHARIRGAVPKLVEDREAGYDVMAAHDVLFGLPPVDALKQAATTLQLSIA
jgi:histidine ammonia-lyase